MHVMVLFWRVSHFVAKIIARRPICDTWAILAYITPRPRCFFGRQKPITPTIKFGMKKKNVHRFRMKLVQMWFCLSISLCLSLSLTLAPRSLRAKFMMCKCNAIESKLHSPSNRRSIKLSTFSLKSCSLIVPSGFRDYVAVAVAVVCVCNSLRGFRFDRIIQTSLKIWS